MVSSVSCLYGLGSPDEFRNRMMVVERGTAIRRREFLLGLSAMQYVRKEVEPGRGNFRVRGDSIEVFPASEQHAVRIALPAALGPPPKVAYQVAYKWRTGWRSRLPHR